MNIIIKTYNQFSIGCLNDLTENQVKQIIEAVKAPALNSNAVLGGRRLVNIFNVEGIGAVAVKHYARGGLMYLINKERYLKIKEERCRIEFQWLCNAKNLNISTPDPVAFVYERKLFYRCWLITRAVKNHQTLANLGIKDEYAVLKFMPEVIHNVSLLIQNKIWHVDLHPGNILIDNSDHIFLVDFDNARNYHGNKENLCRRYIARWGRAVKKHRLPRLMADSFKDALKN